MNSKGVSTHAFWKTPFIVNRSYSYAFAELILPFDLLKRFIFLDYNATKIYCYFVFVILVFLFLESDKFLV